MIAKQRQRQYCCTAGAEAGSADSYGPIYSDASEADSRDSLYKILCRGADEVRRQKAFMTRRSCKMDPFDAVRTWSPTPSQEL